MYVSRKYTVEVAGINESIRDFDQLVVNENVRLAGALIVLTSDGTAYTVTPRQAMR